MKTAITGLGNIGGRVAKNLVAGGQSIIVAERNLDKAKAFAAGLGGAASGFAPVSAGGIDQSARIEAFGDLDQYGKLRRLVSVKEAVALI